MHKTIYSKIKYVKQAAHRIITWKKNRSIGIKKHTFFFCAKTHRSFLAHRELLYANFPIWFLIFFLLNGSRKGVSWLKYQCVLMYRYGCAVIQLEKRIKRPSPVRRAVSMRTKCTKSYWTFVKCHYLLFEVKELW